METVTHPGKGSTKVMGIVFQNSRVVGMEEEPLNRSCVQRGNIAWNNLYYYFYLLLFFALLLMLPVEKGKVTCTGF